MIRVIDNLLTPTFANVIANDAENILQYAYCRETSKQSGHYTGPIYKDSNTYDYGQLSCPLIIDQYNNFPFTWYLNILKPLMYTVQDKVPELDFKGMVRVKFNLLMQRPDALPDHYNIPHQDSVGNCYSMVYYCDDSDGDTFLFNEFYEEGKVPEKLTIAQRVTPRKNRAVIFESNRYHAASNPIVNKDRFVINFVIEARKK